MTIGIYTYGTRGDVQPYIALALALMEKGHQVVLSAPGDFKDFVEGFGIAFFSLYGEAETVMSSPDGQAILKTENSIKLMPFYFKAVARTVSAMGERIRNEKATERAVAEIEGYFSTFADKVF